MKTQSISNQNFEGNIIFVDKFRTKQADSIENFLTGRLGKKYMDKVQSLIEEKPFDVFISRNEYVQDSYIVEAGKSYEEVLLERRKCFPATIRDKNDDIRLLSQLHNVVGRVIDSYEDLMTRKDKISEYAQNFVLSKYKK